MKISPRKEDIIHNFKIDSSKSSIELTSDSGIAKIDTTIPFNSEHLSFSNIEVFQLKNNRYFITADCRYVYSAAQVKHVIEKNKSKYLSFRNGLKILDINEKDYKIIDSISDIFLNKGYEEVIFHTQKLYTKSKHPFRIECINYCIIY